MTYKVIERTEVLTPNLKHNNFNKTNQFFEEGEILEGKAVAIKGKRKGSDFVYHLLKIEPNKFIKLKQIEPMKEVNIGADASKEPTVVKVPNNAKPLKWHLLLAGVGAIGGYMYAKKKGKGMNQALIYAGVAGVAGYAVGNVIYRKKMVTISK